MKNTLLIITLFFSIALFSQTTTQTIHSTKLEADREITIKLPASYNKKTEKKYPLILVLDGEYLFAPFEGNLAFANYWDDIPEVILVGINQNKKEERYDDSEFDPATGLPSAKGGAFFEFIATELIPSLEKKYRIAPFKIIAGLDATAGLLNSFLYKEIPQFNAYISLSPELAKGMTERIPQRLAATKEPLFYYQATADGDLKKFQNQIKALDKNITAIKNSSLNYKFDDFKNASHYSLVLNGIPNALYQIFSIYRPISSLEYQEKIAVLPDSHAKYLTDKYETIQKSLGIKMNVRLSDFKAIEAAILKTGDFKGYEELAQISGQQYEKSMLYDYHMAMFYEKTNDIKKAVKFYQNAFMKEEIRELTKEMMMNKAEDLKKLIPVKAKGLKGGKAKEIIEDVPASDTPTTDIPPTEKPAETPTEEKKP
ncbi:alpha/beta hydrolase [Flavobacterium psychrophilum]|uniref:alpha/beta hydrolase n=1 Tax=Flavobacterium psychrophilum TaxID=96345 RepID=UPI000B7C2781|nr:alpha/beta hydrolase-fold protein [Flavobacterium psychrophilum]MBF2023572.1 alpha/beta hydrolase [Flavobacterium psychrophilum]MCB5982974.1 alpha/beta hydrolase [Flavobacterium psychrophilum]MCB5994157.1 alpha/beta hydrolase [Flavobacterium psychrophilum]MCB5997089.1 alpha/beta hydrolase [Flavobacterium psychrophilum]MCB6004435.1 alpha/beta hydrolase [Flavobacterium psychrophilum]